MISIKAAIKAIETKHGFTFTHSRVIHRGCLGSTLVAGRFYFFETKEGQVHTFGTAQLRSAANAC